MASRWMQPKLAKMKRERLFTPAVTHNRSGHTLETANKIALETAALVAAYKGPITKAAAGKPLAQVGKGKRSFNAGMALDQWGGSNRMGGERKQRGVAAALLTRRHDGALDLSTGWEQREWAIVRR